MEEYKFDSLVTSSNVEEGVIINCVSESDAKIAIHLSTDEAKAIMEHLQQNL